MYVDSNIFRYVASGELEIITVGSVRFAYSDVHFDEIIRSGNTDMLKGIEALKAVPLVTNEHGEYDIDHIGVCLEYEDPYENFARYQESTPPDDEGQQGFNELLLRLLGADNFEELSKIPNSLTTIARDAKRYEYPNADELAEKAINVAEDFESFIEKDLSQKRPLTKTRREFGFPYGLSNEDNPIDVIWDSLKEKVEGKVTKEQFFGFESIPGVEVELSRIGSVAGCHLVLNMMGFHPDKGLPKHNKIGNILSDGRHLGYASLCGGFLTSDYRLYKKADAIFKYRKFVAKATHVPYKKEGMIATIIQPSSLKKYSLKENANN